MVAACNFLDVCSGYMNYAIVIAGCIANIVRLLGVSYIIYYAVFNLTIVLKEGQNVLLCAGFQTCAHNQTQEHSLRNALNQTADSFSQYVIKLGSHNEWL